MDSSRTLRAFVACLPACFALFGNPAAAAQSGEKHTLAAQHRPGELVRVQVALQVGGDVKLVGEAGKSLTLPMSVVANLGYDEALLAVTPAGLAARSVRYYDDTRAVIKIDKGGERPTLDDSRRLIIAERNDKTPCLLYSPNGALKREELDLVDVPAGTLVLDELLPGRAVALGETWKLTDATMAALLCLDAVSYTDVECVLGEVKDGLADVAAAGHVAGAVGGIATDIEVKIKFKFDFALKRVTSFAVLIKEERAVGHVGPGLDTVAKVLLKVTPIVQSQTLTREVVARLPKSATPELLDLGYSPPSRAFRFQYDRRWFITDDETKLAVLRMIDRGELVAQCNLSALPKVQKPVTLSEFQRDVERSLGKNFGQFTSATQHVNTAGYAVFRVVVTGTISEVPVEWIYYLVQDRQGRRVSLAFSMQQSVRERFAQADVRVIKALELTDPPTPTAARPVTTN